MGLGVQVLAAPATLYAVPAASGLEKVSRNMNAIVKDLEKRLLPTIGGVENEVSSIAERDSASITTIVSDVAILQAGVSLELISIDTSLASEITEEVVYKIKGSLLSIATSFNETIIGIQNVIEGGIQGLVEADIELLIKALTDIKTVVAQIETSIKSILAVQALETNAIIFIQVSILRAFVQALVTPLTAFASSVSASFKGSLALAEQLQASASAVVNVSGNWVAAGVIV